MKMVSDYEVEGCWTTQTSQSKCRACGTVKELVPDSFEHYNARYWKLKRNDGLDLYCCPNGCSVEKAEKKMREWCNFFSGFCKEGGNSGKYELDYNKFRNCWITPEGRVYPCRDEGHWDLASNLDTNERALENKGWCKITTIDWHAICMDDNGFTQRQVDKIFDFCIAHDLQIEGLEKGENVHRFKPNKPIY